MSIAFPSLSNLLSSFLLLSTPQPPPTSNLLPVFTQPSSFPPLVTATTPKPTPTIMFFKSGYYNVQVVPEDDEPEEKLVSRFRRSVLRAGVLQECRRRRFFETSQEKKKRKARDAAKKNRRRRPQPKASSESSKQVRPEKREEQNEEDDNWEIPEVEIPYTN